MQTRSIGLNAKKALLALIGAGLIMLMTGSLIICRGEGNPRLPVPLFDRSGAASLYWRLFDSKDLEKPAMCCQMMVIMPAENR
jgi:hypothetical protein